MQKVSLILAIFVTAVFSHSYFASYDYHDAACQELKSLDVVVTGECVNEKSSYVLYTCEGDSFNITYGCDASCANCAGYDSNSQLDVCLGGYQYSCPEELIAPSFEYLALTSFEENDCSGEPQEIQYLSRSCQPYHSDEKITTYSYFSCEEDQATQMVCTDSNCTQNCATSQTYITNACTAGQMYVCGDGSSHAAFLIPCLMLVVLSAVFAF